MNPDPASLTNLRDIVAPPEVSWWPPAAGWWWLSAIVLAVAVRAAWLGWRRWRADAYRREALRALGAAGTTAEIAELLKRTALASHPRAEVAALCGDRWLAWLAESGGEPVPADVGRSLTSGAYAPRDPASLAPLAEFAARWIRTHRAGPRETVERRAASSGGVGR